MSISNRKNQITSEKRSTSNFRSFDAIVFNDPETKSPGHPPLFVKSFIDETAVEIIQSSDYSEHEFHPAIPAQETLLSETRRKSSFFKSPFSFRGLLSVLDVSPLEFFGIIVACLLLGAGVNLFSQKHSESGDNVQTLLEKVSVIEQYLYRDEQRELQRH
jgi:hypothetical protein